MSEIGLEKKLYPYYGSIAVFTVMLLVGFAYQFYWIALVPFALVVAWLCFFSYDKAIQIIAFCVPFSITEHDIGFGAGLILPTEPIIIILMLLTLFKLIIEKNFSGAFWKHPITILIIINTVWIFITSLSSTMPLVSFKFLLARLWYILVFFVLASYLFTDTKRAIAFINTLLLSVGILVTIIMLRHAPSGFSRDMVNTSIYPFFWVHGVYAAHIALFAPIFFVFAFYGKEFGFSPLRRSILGFYFIVFVLAVMYSYTRAAWLSLFAAAALYFIIVFRLRLWMLVGGIAIASITFFSAQEDIFVKLSRNKQGSSSKSIEKHLQSATNIKNDPSNLERINRWSCAWRMVKDKPILGFGPGTFMFQYAPYQLSYQKTSISTNFATLGHAHSEYFGPMAESGFFGMFNWIAVFIATIIVALLLIYRTKNVITKRLATALLLSLITYYVHGTLNAYLDYDKLAVPFWAFTGMIVLLDIQDKKERKTSI